MKILIPILILLSSWDLLGQNVALDPTDLEIDGLVIDETRTRIGRDFYEKFYKIWMAPVGASDYSIFVEEQPPRGRQVVVQVKVKEKIVSFHSLQPREEMIEEAVKLAAARTFRHLQHYSQMQNDLEESDQSGSGIF